MTRWSALRWLMPPPSDMDALLLLSHLRRSAICFFQNKLKTSRSRDAPLISCAVLNRWIVCGSMDLLAVGFAAFVVGVLGGGAFAWLLATMRTRTAMQAALREADSRGAAATARAEALARNVEDQRALLD